MTPIDKQSLMRYIDSNAHPQCNYVELTKQLRDVRVGKYFYWETFIMLFVYGENKCT